MCEECALQHVRRVLCCQAAFTCCVSVEISPTSSFVLCYKTPLLQDSLLQDSYKSRIEKDASLDVCTDCGKTPHDVKHLFACPAHPTTLIPSDQLNLSGKSAISRREAYTETNQDLRRTTTTGGEWMRGLGLDFTNSVGIWECWTCLCFGCGGVGGVGGEWVGGLDQGLEGWCYVCVRGESVFSV